MGVNDNYLFVHCFSVYVALLSYFDASEMYLCFLPQVTSADRSIVYTTLRDRDYIGESCLLEVEKRTASAYAVGYVDTYVLSSEDFDMVSEGCLCVDPLAGLCTLYVLMI